MIENTRKVVIIGSAYPYRGGLAAYNERLAKAYSDQGYDVEIQTFTVQYPNFLFPGKSQYSDSSISPGIKIKRTVNSVNPFNWISVGNKLKRQKPDLVIIKFWIPFMSPCFGTIAKIIRKNKYSKIISIIDNIIPHEKRPGDHILAKYFVNNVDGFIAMSKSVLNDLELFDKKKPKLFCPHPLYDNFGEIISKDAAKSNLNLDKKYNYLLFFGLIRDYKGLDLLLEAFSKAPYIKLNLKLLVAGEFYCDSKPYYEIIKKHSLEDFVIMSNGFIPDEKVKDFFCASDIVVQPYKNATQSGVTQIAYHFNKPMIVTDVGGLSEIVPDNKVGFVVRPEIKEISNAIEIFYNEGKETEFVNNTIIEKKNYSWEKLINKIDELIKNVI
jgi:D-inositol-3-phosphate glycosyltransferase